MAIGDGIAAFVTVPGSGAVTIQPPSGEEWLFRDLAAGGLPAGIDLGLYDGTNYAPVRYDNSAIWFRPLRMYITNTTYARIVNTTGVSITLAYNAIVTAVPGTMAGPADAKTAVVTLAGSASVTVQPPAGETWSVSEVGSTQTYTFSGSTYPNVIASVSDGVHTSAFYNASGDNYTRPWPGIITNATYLVLKNQSGSPAVVCYSAVRMS